MYRLFTLLLTFIIPFLIFILVIAVRFVIYAYNRIKSSKLQIDESRSNIDVYLQKRYEEISSIYKIATEFKLQEEKVLKEIVQLRELAQDSGSDPKTMREIHDQVANKLPEMFVRMEQYPQIKSQENFLHLQRSIENNEANISASRAAYNSYVNDYNTSIALFPLNIVANIFGFKEEEYYEVVNKEQLKNPLI